MEVSRQELGAEIHGEREVRTIPVRDDVVGKPLFDQVPASSKEELLTREASQQKDYQALVARQLSFGRDPEAYWKQLCAERDATSGLGTPGSRSDSERGLRHEMQALVPHLARRLVQRDSLRFVDPNMYVAQLDRMIRSVETQAELARKTGTNLEQRALADQTRVLFVQRDIASQWVIRGSEAWRNLRVQAVQEQQKNSEPPELPAGAVELRTWQDQLASLRRERDGLRFWQLLRRSELNGQIAELEKREAYERKKQQLALEQKRKEETTSFEKWKAERGPAEQRGHALRVEMEQKEQMRRRETATMPDLQPVRDTIARAKQLFDSTDLAERVQAASLRARVAERLLTELDRISVVLRNGRVLTNEEVKEFLSNDRRVSRVPQALFNFSQQADKSYAFDFARKSVWRKRAGEVILVIKELDSLSSIERWSRARVEFRKQLAANQLSIEQQIRKEAQLDELWRQGIPQSPTDPLQRYLEIRRVSEQPGLSTTDKLRYQWQTEEVWREAAVASAGKVFLPKEFQAMRDNQAQQ